MALQGHSNDIGAIATTTDHSMFVTGCVAGELLFWNVDRALPVAKLQLPKVAKGANQVYQPRAGVIYMDILQYPPIPGQNKHCYLLLIGTEDGTLFFVDMLNHRFVHSMPNLLPDGISGIVFDVVNGDHAVHSRLLVSDVVKTAKLYDISQLSFGDVDGTLSLLKTWRPHPKASSITCVERLDVLDCFVTGSDLWTFFVGVTKASSCALSGKDYRGPCSLSGWTLRMPMTLICWEIQRRKRRDRYRRR